MQQGAGFIKQANKLTAQIERSFAGFGKKRKNVPKDLPKYDCVVVGGNLGGILTRHFDDAHKGKFNCFCAFDRSQNEAVPVRNVYEQSRCTKTDYFPNTALAFNQYTPHSGNVGVTKFLPDESAIVLRNGRRIEYEQLVIAMGLQDNVDAIEGFEDAWKDVDHPVHCSKDHPSWKAVDHKYQKYHYNFTNGDAIFCIPPYPFRGEIGAYNFLLSQQIWQWYQSHGKLSPLHTFTIMNANDKFSQFFDEADDFIKAKIAEKRINVEYGWNLVKVNKDNQTAVFRNVESGEEQTRDYNNLYAIPPTKPHQTLVDAGLVNEESNYLLPVHKETLRHEKYSNIFGLGDINNVPTTKTFFGGFYQLHVVNNNVLRALQGQSLNALYDGYAESSLILGQQELTKICHHYDQKPGRFNMLGSQGGILSRIRYLQWARGVPKSFQGLYLFKSRGPPYYKISPKFSELPADKEAQLKEQMGGYQAVNKAEATA